MALKDILDQAREQLTKQAGITIDSLAAIATSLEMKETAARLRATGQSLKSDTFNLIVIGRFKNGKSTLMNALLGRPTHPIPELANGHGPMPVDDLPCTATLTSICYADQPFVRMWRFDGRSEEWSLARYLRDSTVRADEEENQKIFKEIRQFELGFPAELCKSGVILYDSPGLDDVPQRTEVTRQAVERCDAAIVVYLSRALAGESELAFVREVVAGTSTRIFTVINMFDGKQADEKFRGFVWNKLVKDERGGPPYAGQDFTTQDIYFVDAKKAEDGKLASDPVRVADSGLALFEQRLGEFLVKERHYTHLQKFIRVADNSAASIEQQIARRRAALAQDEQKLQQAYEAIQPQLTAIRARREKLPKIFERYRLECQRTLKVSFEQMITRLRQDLPAELKVTPLPSLQNGMNRLLSTFQQKKLCQEGVQICNDIITRRVTEWSKKDAPETVTPIVGRLFEEISEEIAQISKEYNQVYFDLTGWTPPGGELKSVISTQERVLSGVIGLAAGDFSAILGPIGGGYRGVAGAFVAGHLAAGLAVSVLGITSAVALLPIIAIAATLGSMAAGSIGFEDRVKAKVLQMADPGLRAMPEQTADKIDQETAKVFSQIEAEVMKQVLAVIEEEERNIQKMVELNKRSQAEKAQSLAMLDDASKKLALQRQALKDVLAKVQQVPEPVQI
jgi:hypothetical protein